MIFISGPILPDSSNMPKSSSVTTAGSDGLFRDSFLKTLSAAAPSPVSHVRPQQKATRPRQTCPRLLFGASAYVIHNALGPDSAGPGFTHPLYFVARHGPAITGCRPPGRTPCARFVREISLGHGRVRVRIDHAAEHRMGIKIFIINKIEGLPGRSRFGRLRAEAS